MVVRKVLKSSTSGQIIQNATKTSSPTPASSRNTEIAIGDLLLLPKSFNASYGDLPYEEKLVHYDSQNLLARSLNANAYDHNPGFLRVHRKQWSVLPTTP